MNATAEAVASTGKERLRDLLKRDAFCQREVSLSNGSASGFYFDCKRVTLSPEGSMLVGQVCLDELERWPERVQAVGGLVNGATPIINSVVLMSGLKSGSLSGFYVRSEPKQHGLMHLIENQPPPGTKVIIVDDVVTSGNSLLKAVRAAKDAGCSVVGAMALVDRNEGGAERIKREVDHYFPLFTKAQDFPDPSV